MLRRTIILVIAAAMVLLAPSPALAAHKSKLGADFANDHGTCAMRTPPVRAIVTCELSERHRVYYRFRIPQNATIIDVTVDRGSRGCCGTIGIKRTRFGVDERVLIVRVRVYNYGDPLGDFEARIRRVEVHFRTAASAPSA